MSNMADIAMTTTYIFHIGNNVDRRYFRSHYIYYSLSLFLQ